MSGGTALVADIGGTNTRVALADGRAVREDTVRRFRNDAHSGLAEVLATYLADAGRPALAGACVAAAGPVRDGRAELTNLDWTIDTATVAEATGAANVAVLNDLQAQGHAIGHVAPDRLRRILDAPAPGPRATGLVIGLGTGFNAAPVHETDTDRYVPPSESGHTSLAIATEAELRLARYIEGIEGGFAETESVLSGRGIVNVHDWLGVEAGDPRPLSGEEIVAAAAAGEPRACAALTHVIAVLGRTAGNLALEYLPFGGVYLVGGAARGLGPHLAPLGFADAFRAKGRFADFMNSFAVTVIEDDYAALVGCAAHLGNRRA